MRESVVFWYNGAVGGVGRTPTSRREPPRAKLILLFSFESVRKDFHCACEVTRGVAVCDAALSHSGVLLNLKAWWKQINEQNTGNNNGEGVANSLPDRLTPSLASSRPPTTNTAAAAATKSGGQADPKFQTLS
jgi:hypothetical protein